MNNDLKKAEINYRRKVYEYNAVMIVGWIVALICVIIHLFLKESTLTKNMQNIEEVQKGFMILIVSNGDDTFSPLAMTQSQALMLNSIIGGLSSEEQPYVLNRDIKLDAPLRICEQIF